MAASKDLSLLHIRPRVRDSADTRRKEKQSATFTYKIHAQNATLFAGSEIHAREQLIASQISLP